MEILWRGRCGEANCHSVNVVTLFVLSPTAGVNERLLPSIHVSNGATQTMFSILFRSKVYDSTVYFIDDVFKTYYELYKKPFVLNSGTVCDKRMNK